MPPRSAESLLFHKKKPVIKKEPSATPPSGSQGTPTPGSPRKSLPPRPQPAPAGVDADDSSKLPEGEFSEYKLMTSALNGWKYDIMRFDSRKMVDISTWEAPIKLNRRDLRKPEAVSAPVPVAPMLGPDGKPVIGLDGKLVMVDADGRPISNTPGEGTSKDTQQKGKGAANGKKKMQRKTRQVFKVPEDVRQLRKEERYPWVMEDARRNEIWVGQLEEVSRAETHALFMPALQDVFKFVPAHRWYKFHKKPKHRIPDLEEAESLMARIQKNKDPERWLLHRRNGQGPSAATTAMFKADPDSVVAGAPLVYSATQSRGPGGRSLMSVNRGSRGLDEEDGEGASRRPKNDDGEGHLDEQLFEDDVADDDEHEAADMDDEEAKELEERLKREYRMANKQREGYIDESEEEEDGDSQLTKDGKSLKKLMRKLEKNVVYDSDEERNPYASSDENEEEEEPPVASNEPAIQPQPQQAKSRPASQQPSPKPAAGSAMNGSNVASRAVSPAPASGMGGHSVVAKRATSPKAPKPSVSRGNSPLSGPPGTSSQAGSPSGSRATSPVAGASKGASGTPSTNKRKAPDESGTASPAAASNGTAPPKPKKRKPLPPGPIDGELEERMLIEWLQSAPNASTRDCIQHFTPYLTSEAKKTRFTAMVKEVAQLKGGVLILKSALRGESATGSPAPAAAT
ncbi:hypothetical protein SCLCIDRAFT_17828 [Scleroderma citrinum Foug A]|uniref:Transcription initiation factor IIF subunit alpha n=1 Tax=Scleroderma citrinum Foug A TaxID=1036808 RepID=A0A0C3DCI0_9AGAM|nr:hypothetical protein SCLCIDRAFT_17828 [Scleroderma citrinum Foug A]